MNKTRLLSAALGSALLVGGIAIAQRPRENINPGRHPNLAEAQRLCEQASEKVSEAQRANEWDMQGHAKKAKQLLDQVNEQLRMAATAANRHER